MSFDAGAVRGRLELDTSNFNKNLDDAHKHADEKISDIRRAFETVKETIGEIAGPALTELTTRFKSAFGEFEHGFGVGSVAVAGAAVLSLGEAVEHTAQRFHTMGLEADKLGVTPEFFSSLAGAASAVGLSAEQLGNSFTLLNRNAALAVDGNKEAAHGFDLLHISSKDLTDHMGDSQWIIEEVLKKLDGLADSSHKAEAAQALLGRSGKELIPFFQMGGEEILKMSRNIQMLGGDVTDSDAKMGLAFGKLEVYAKAAADGIEAAFARPMLKFFEDNLDLIVEKLHEIELAIPKTFKFLKDDLHLGDAANFIKREYKDLVGDPLLDLGEDAGRKNAIINLGYDPRDMKQPLPHRLRPHWTDPNWKDGHAVTPDTRDTDLISIYRDLDKAHDSKSAASVFNHYLDVQTKSDPSGINDNAEWNNLGRAINHRMHDTSTGGGSSSLDLGSLPVAIAQGVGQALDSHASTHANSGVTDVLQGWLDQANGGGAGGRGPATRPGDGAQGSQNTNVNINVTVSNQFDPQAAAREVARAVLPSLQQVSRDLKSGIAAEAQRTAAGNSTGGR